MIRRKNHKPPVLVVEKKGEERVKKGKKKKIPPQSPPKPSDLPQKPNLGSCLPLQASAVYQVSHPSCLERSPAPE